MTKSEINRLVEIVYHDCRLYNYCLKEDKLTGGDRAENLDRQIWYYCRAISQITNNKIRVIMSVSPLYSMPKFCTGFEIITPSGKIDYSGCFFEKGGIK